jgi:hypothetical protein
MDMQQMMTAYVEGIAELMEDADYSRFSWGADVTREVIYAAALVAWREFGAAHLFATGDVLDILARGWTSYNDLAELAAQDEEGDELNSLMIRFDFPPSQREAAENFVGERLIKEIRDKADANGHGETVVWYGDADFPGERLIHSIFVFNKKTEA